jgi:hypothetical protein
VSLSVVQRLSFFLTCVVAGVAHRLHSKHGKNVVLLGEGCQAVRVGGYAHGIVFSAKELKTDELFEVSSALLSTQTQSDRSIFITLESSVVLYMHAHNIHY